MAEAITVREYGPSSVLKVVTVEIGAPGPGELRIRQTAIGVNYHDVYVRSGLYKTLALPGVPGCEAAGEIVAIGPGVNDFQIGDRVAYVTSTYGAYASERLLPAIQALKLPDIVSDLLAGTTLLRALTVEMLVGRVHRIEAGMTILVHAAAGGVGRLLCQWTAHIGATVIGTVGSEDKAAAAKASGCAHTILYRETEFKAAVMEITKGRGVDVAYDSVGADTFSSSLECLVPCGHLVNYGQSSGPVEPLAMTTLAANSLTVSRPILFHYMADPAQYQSMAQTVFDMLGTGILKPDTPMPLPLADASKAHDILEGRTGGGALVLIP